LGICFEIYNELFGDAAMNKTVKNVFEGELSAKGLRFAIVCGRFNEFFVSKLLDGAVDALVRHGGKSDDIDVAWVPGSYEVPFAAKKFVDAGKYDAIIALGVVIQGATPHANFINSEVSKCLAQIGMDSGVPVIYGMITADNIEQAIERSGTKAGNKGSSAAETAIEMANLNRVMPKK
jgi:6,7-dimethyl-8-ribityllumazine synthase